VLKDRLLKIAEHYGLTPNKFSEIIGMSRAFIKNINEEISTKPMRNILLKFPEVNIVWLLTGEGEMILKNTNAEIETTEKTSPEFLLEYLKEKDKTIGDLREEIGRLKQELLSHEQREGSYDLDVNDRNAAEKEIEYKKSK